MKCFGRFFNEFQKDLKAFIFWCILFFIFRVIFIACYNSQITEAKTEEILMALWLGFRLSLKTVGVITLISVSCATLPKTFYKKWPADKVRFIAHSVMVIFFTVLFFARISYYKIFNSGFNMMLINGAHDDIKAIIMTGINEYQLLWRLPAAIIVGVIICYILKIYWRFLPNIDFNNVEYKKIVALLTAFFIPIFWVFVRFGGSFTYAYSINWLSAARLKFNLLNEAVLDDGQALYRVYDTKRKLDKITNVDISAEELKAKIAFLGGNTSVNSIDQAFERIVQKERLIEKPTNVVVIIGESFGLWPFLPEFEDLGLVDKSLALQNSSNATNVEYMLANSTGTIGGINGIVTGLPDTGRYENYMPNPNNTIYKSGIAYIMKQLGYKTIFWYGGFSSWENIKNFALVQGFDEFHCADEFEYMGGNSWGCPDKVLFSNIEKYIQQQGTDKVLHVVMTSSNHPSYVVDVDNEGFNRDEVKGKLPESIFNNDTVLTELGHFWYADHIMGNFIEVTNRIIPQSLFVVTGDHSERFTFAKEQDVKTLSAIPCIIYGNGVKKEWLQNKVGVTMQIPATVAELIAPAGFKYTAFIPSIFYAQEVFNYRLYANDKEIGVLQDNLEAQKIADNAKSIASWRILKGDKF